MLTEQMNVLVLIEENEKQGKHLLDAGHNIV